MISVKSFIDELEKIAQRSYTKDFMAGVDPTGTSTFQYGMQDTQHGGPSRARQMMNTAGGVIGGAAVIPAAVGGTVGALKGFAMGQGGLGRRLMAAGKGAATGAIDPYKKLYQGTMARQALVAHQAGKELTGRQAGHLGRFVEGQIPGGLIKTKLSPQQVRSGLQGMSPKAISEARRQMTGEIAGGAGALGLSGAISGGSAYMQYGKGAKTQESVNQQLAGVRNPRPIPAAPTGMPFLGYRS